MAVPPVPPGAADPPEWLGQLSFFRTVRGYEEAVVLLNDGRMHADFGNLIRGAGASDPRLIAALDASLLSLNGDEHKRIRSLFSHRFTPRAVEWVRPVIRQDAEARVDAVARRGSCDVVTDLASEFVARGTCAFVGFPLDEVADLVPAIDLVSRSSKDLGSRMDGYTEGILRLFEYADRALRERLRRPSDDILTVLAREVDAGTLPTDVAHGVVACLLSAGHEPTINQICLMVEVLSEHADIWDAVGSGGADPGPIVEETLRLRSTNQAVNRRADEDFEFRGVHFREGEQVLIQIAEANHDPRRYDRPDELDVEGHRGSHLAFGFGAHYCLGAALARVQLQEILRAMAGRLTCPTIVRAAYPEVRGGLVGPEALDISFRSRAPAI